MKRGLRAAAVSAALTCAALGCGFDLEVEAVVSSDAGSSVPDAARTDAGPRPPVDSSTSAPDAAASPIVGPLRWQLEPGLDAVSNVDGALRSDGVVDGVFEVEVQGPVIALALLRTDAAGQSVAGQQWDTYVKADTWPEPLAPELRSGVDSYQLGVLEAGTPRNDAEGRCALGSSGHTLQLAAHDVGSFVSGSSFRLVVESTAHVLVRGPVLTLP